MTFIILRYVPSVSTLLRVFIMNGCWILSWMDVEFCQMLFLCLLKWMIVAFPFVNVVFHIDWWILNHLCITSNKSHLIMVCDPFYYCWLGLLIFCWGFLYLYSLNLLACNFLFFSVWFWYQGNCRGAAPVDPGWFEGGGTELVSLEKYIFNHRYREIRNG